MMSEPQTLPGHIPPPLFFLDLKQSLARLQKGGSAEVPGETPLHLQPEWVCWLTPRQPWALSRLLLVTSRALWGLACLTVTPGIGENRLLVGFSLSFRYYIHHYHRTTQKKTHSTCLTPTPKHPPNPAL